MSRISLVDPSDAPAGVKPLLDAVQAQLGVTRNFIRVLAHLSVALGVFTTLVGKSTKVAIDFPAIKLLQAA